MMDSRETPQLPRETGRSPNRAIMKIVIGSDHAGFSCKREIIAQLRAKDITVVDVGTDSEAPVSYGHSEK